MILTRRRAINCAGAALGGLLFAPPAQATTALALTLPQLVARSARVSVGTALAYRSEWAYLGGADRIVTWTRVLASSTWAGGPDESDEVMVLTLGGRVGKIVQKVHGEATLRIDEPALLFLSDEVEGTRRVVGMAQGHYPTEESDGKMHLRRSQHLGHLVTRRQPGQSGPQPQRAVDALDGLSLDDARQLIGGLR